MDCSVSFTSFTRGFQLLKAGSTSKLYYSTQKMVVAKQITKYIEHGAFQREICLLDKLQVFSWSPKLLCVGKDYFVTQFVGPQSCNKFPKDYRKQMRRIVNDMQSLTIRQNDMLKSASSSDVIIGPNGVVHLTDFGWGTFNNSLEISCTVYGRSFRSPNTRPVNDVINQGFSNVDEFHHANPCFKSFRQRNGQGSQKESPQISLGRDIVVSGYQKFNFSRPKFDLNFRGKKYEYLQQHLPKLTYRCGHTCHFVDIGSNTGLVSFIAERAGFPEITALDHDIPAIDILQKAANAVHSNIKGRQFKFGQPLPSADVVFCGALIHWVFCLTADFEGDFLRIVQYVAKSARHYLIFEWVDNDDAAIKSFHHIKKCDTQLERNYSRDGFFDALKTIGQITEEKDFGTRTLVTVLIRHEETYLS